MADQENVDIEKLSPDKLLLGFRKSRIMLWIIAAFALHVLVLGATSVDDIHGMIDPDWKAEQERIRLEARQKARAAEEAKAARLRPPAAAPASRLASRPASKPVATQPAGPDGRKLPKELTTMPKAGEVPKVPGAGIGLDETTR